MRRIESLVSSVWSNTMRDLEGDKGWGRGSVTHRTFGKYTESRLSLIRYLVRGEDKGFVVIEVRFESNHYALTLK